MVFWKAASEAEREPRAEGVRTWAAEGDEADSEEAAVAKGWDCSWARSLRMAVLCLRALLKVVF